MFIKNPLLELFPYVLHKNILKYFLSFLCARANQSTQDFNLETALASNLTLGPREGRMGESGEKSVFRGFLELYRELA